MAQYLDMEFALQQLGGDKQLLNNMLKRFVNQYGLTAEHIRQLMTDKQWQEARQLVHSLKGVAGNLGMTPLYQSASTLEHGLKSASADAMQHYPAFTHDLDATLAEIQALLSGPSLVSAATTEATADPLAYQTLVAMLQSNEFISPSKLDSLLGSLSLTEENRGKLHDLISDLEYHQAIKFIQQL
ncbi:Hpt domain-containing protein [Bowmanella denitrificans]|uniref:Hpt domain-containing protein n=1 Tax=Bowmanella denitrificans TaxID=366582 RepID=UPI001559E224|nr:Hpt domain-containing protein [Bowmanella denitrificans]